MQISTWREFAWSIIPFDEYFLLESFDFFILPLKHTIIKHTNTFGRQIQNVLREENTVSYGTCGACQSAVCFKNDLLFAVKIHWVFEGMHTISML